MFRESTTTRPAVPTVHPVAGPRMINGSLEMTKAAIVDDGVTRSNEEFKLRLANLHPMDRKARLGSTPIIARTSAELPVEIRAAMALFPSGVWARVFSGEYKRGMLFRGNTVWAEVKGNYSIWPAQRLLRPETMKDALLPSGSRAELVHACAIRREARKTPNKRRQSCYLRLLGVEGSVCRVRPGLMQDFLEGYEKNVTADLLENEDEYVMGLELADGFELRRIARRDDKKPCMRCGKVEEVDLASIIICDMCGGEVHMACMFLPGVPDGRWFCPVCRVAAPLSTKTYLTEDSGDFDDASDEEEEKGDVPVLPGKQPVSNDDSDDDDDEDEEEELSDGAITEDGEDELPVGPRRMVTPPSMSATQTIANVMLGMSGSTPIGATDTGTSDSPIPLQAIAKRTPLPRPPPSATAAVRNDPYPKPKDETSSLPSKETVASQVAGRVPKEKGALPDPVDHVAQPIAKRMRVDVPVRTAISAAGAGTDAHQSQPASVPQEQAYEYDEPFPPATEDDDTEEDSKDAVILSETEWPTSAIVVPTLPPVVEKVAKVCGPCIVESENDGSAAEDDDGEILNEVLRTLEATKAENDAMSARLSLLDVYLGEHQINLLRASLRSEIAKLFVDARQRADGPAAETLQEQVVDLIDGKLMAGISALRGICGNSSFCSKLRPSE